MTAGPARLWETPMPHKSSTSRATRASLVLAVSLASGAAWGATPLAPIATTPTRPVSIVSAGGTDSGLIVMLHEWSEGRSLSYRRFAADGTPLGPPIAFAFGESGLGEPLVRWNGAEWLIAWFDRGATHLTRIGAGGELIATERAAVQGRPLALAGTEGRWLLVSAGESATNAAILDATARNVIAFVPLTGIRSPVAASAAGDRFVVVGQDGAGTVIASQSISFDGARLGDTQLVNVRTTKVDLARSGAGFIVFWLELGGNLRALRLDANGFPAGESFRPFGDLSVGSFNATSAGDRVMVAASAGGTSTIRVASIPTEGGEILTAPLSDAEGLPHLSGLSQATVVKWLTKDQVEGRSLSASLTGPSISSTLSHYATEHHSLTAAGDEYRIAVWIENTLEGWRARGVRIIRGFALDIIPLDFGPAQGPEALVGVGAIDDEFLVIWTGPDQMLSRRLMAASYDDGVPPVPIPELDALSLDDLVIITDDIDFIVFGVARPELGPPGARELVTQRIPRNPLAPIPAPATHWSGASQDLTHLEVAHSGGRFLTVWAEKRNCVTTSCSERTIWAQHVDRNGIGTTVPFLLSDHPEATAPVVAGFHDYFFIAWREEGIVGTIVDPWAGRVFPPPVLLREPLLGEVPEAALWNGFEIILATNRRILTTNFALEPGSIRATPSTLEHTAASLTFGGDSTPELTLRDRLPLGPHGGAPRAFIQTLPSTPLANIETTIRPLASTTGVRHEIAIRNLGPATATGVRLDVEGSVGIAVDAPAAQCVGNRCLLDANLPPGAAWLVQVGGASSGSWIMAEAAAVQRDPQPSNNRATQEIEAAPSRRRAVSRP
jgi:hypothetical protein